MRKLVSFIVLALAALFLASACGGGEEAGAPATTPSAQETRAPSLTTTPTAGTGDREESGLEMKTPVGTFIIAEVRLTDRFGQQVVEPGHQLLVVSLQPKDLTQTSYETFERELKAWRAEVFVTGSDGSPVVSVVEFVEFGGAPATLEFLRGEGELEIEYVTLVGLVFAPSVSAHDFKLFSPGNPPIDLGK